MVAAAFLPLLVRDFGVATELTWRASSGAFVVIWLLAFSFAQLRFSLGADS